MLLLFGKCEQLHLTNVICKSDTIFKPGDPIETSTETALFDRCKFEHPDLEAERRISLDNLRLNWKYTSKLFKFDQLTELCLS